jgi:hypothetical protein
VRQIVFRRQSRRSVWLAVPALILVLLNFNGEDRPFPDG